MRVKLTYKKGNLTMKAKRECLLGLFLAVLFSLPAYAKVTSNIPRSNPGTYRGVRQVGMGNAGLALAAQTEDNRDNTAWFYNPAATHDYERDFHFDFMQIQGDISLSVVQLVRDVFDLADDVDSAATNQAQVDVFEAFVQSRFGDFQAMDAQVLPFVMTHKWFSLGVLVDSRTALSFRNQAYTNFEVLSQSDAGLVAGTAFGFLDDRLQVGTNVKVLYRGEVNELITVDDILNQDNLGADLNRGLGVGGDIGVKGQIPTFDNAILEYLAPTAALTYQDVGDTRFQGATNTEQSISAGLAIHPRIPLGSKGMASHLAIDMRELNQDKDLLTKLNVGYEIELPKLLFINTAVRGGLNQGYPAGGISFDFKLAKLEAAIYGQEMGAHTREKGLYRVALRTSIGF